MRALGDVAGHHTWLRTSKDYAAGLWPADHMAGLTLWHWLYLLRN